MSHELYLVMRGVRVMRDVYVMRDGYVIIDVYVMRFLCVMFDLPATCHTTNHRFCS